MPLYEYFCANCNTNHELLEKAQDAPRTECPVCKSTQFSRVIPRSFGMQFQGSGFYITDYGQSSSPKPQKNNESSSSHCHSPSCGCDS